MNSHEMAYVKTTTECSQLLDYNTNLVTEGKAGGVGVGEGGGGGNEEEEEEEKKKYEEM